MVNNRSRGRKDIADLITEIVADEDGPDPMRHLRSAEKRPNGADQFRSDHRSPVHAIRQQSVDRIKSVNDHNRAYPRLDNELHRKRLFTKVTTIKAEEINEGLDWNCSACAKLATYNDLKKKNLKPRCAGALRRCKRCKHVVGVLTRSETSRCSLHRKPVERPTGISKTQVKKEVNSNCKLSKQWIHRSCQCSNSCMIRKVSKYCTTQSTVTFEDKGEGKLSPVTSVVKPLNIEDQHDPDENQRRNKHPSTSSYNTYGSMDHEPMDF